LLIDLKLDGKIVIVVGGGAEAYRKLQSVVDSGAKIWVISRDFSAEVQTLGEEKRVALLKTGIKDAQAFVDSLNPKPFILLAVTNDSALNLGLVNAAKYYGCMVYSVDNPSLSDFIFTAVAHGHDSS
jgi:precorrin-2 dehydrogenase / sirohydrochlorin ferrochelatase